MLLLILLQTEVEAIVQEKSYKKNTVRALGSNSSKMILTLLTEVITFYERLTTIHFSLSILQWLLAGSVRKGNLGFKIVLTIFCTFSSECLAIKASEKPTIGSTELSWIDSGEGEDPERSSEVRSLQGHSRPRIEVFLMVWLEKSGVNPKQQHF